MKKHMKINIFLLKIITVLLLVGLFFFGNYTLFILAYIFEGVIISARTLMGQARKRVKFMLIVSNMIVMSFQITVCVIAGLFDPGNPVHLYYPRKLFAILLFALPIIVNRYISTGKYASFYLPSISEAATISLSEAKDGVGFIRAAASKINEMGGKITNGVVLEIISDLPRHDSFRYISSGSLSSQFFEKAKETLSDPYIYIVVSRTGSAASEFISVFTQKEYGHASLAFDKDLKTVISYNKGDKVYSPGLNAEMIEYFNQSKDSAFLVYRLPATYDQKKCILDKVEEINQEGSAYNMLGLVVNYSHKPNIMYCSQFVYNMLEHAGLSYFTMLGHNVKPTDLIEQDYYKKLEFLYEIKFH